MAMRDRKCLRKTLQKEPCLIPEADSRMCRSPERNVLCKLKKVMQPQDDISDAEEGTDTPLFS